MSEISTIIIYIASLITAIGIIIGAFKSAAKKIMEPINKGINGMDARQCRAYLVNYLTDVENGIEKSEVQTQLAHEMYEHYTVDLNGNSYIHAKWKKVMGDND